MNRQWKWIVITSLLLSMTSWIHPVSANSAQQTWYGVDATGAIVMNGNSPIVVEQEILTLDIQEFPKNYYSSIDEFLNYSGKVSAEYTFYNPSEYQVTMKLAFPFGTEPAYMDFYDYENEVMYHNVDTEKYGITVDGQVIEPTLRYTFNQFRENFNLEEDLPKLMDSYVQDEFFYPGLPVSKYTFEISGVDLEAYPAANVAFDYDGGNGATKLYFVNQSGYHTQKDGDGRISAWVETGDELVIYVLGEDFEEFPTWSFYRNGGVEDHEVIDGTVSFIGKETFTFEDMVFAIWKEEYGVSRNDWYNAMVEQMNYYGGASNFAMLDFNYRAEDLLPNLMRWYVYELTLTPNSRVVNTVTAPIYPSIDASYEPPVYEYTYLLSPASTYSDFANLDIIVHTPFHLIKSELDGFEKGEHGYVLHLEELPEGELIFTLSSEEKPSRKRPALGYFMPILGIGSFSILFIIGMISLTMFKKYKEH